MVDLELTKQDADNLQHRLINENRLVIWVVTTNTLDFGNKFIARPIIVPALYPMPEHGHLIANSLQELRDMLPYGLSRLSRQIDDDPVIVETWL